jgi:hypothetical protein
MRSSMEFSIHTLTDVINPLIGRITRAHRRSILSAQLTHTLASRRVETKTALKNTQFRRN